MLLIGLDVSTSCTGFSAFQAEARHLMFPTMSYLLESDYTDNVSKADVVEALAQEGYVGAVEVGDGFHGTVWSATDQQGRQVAIKTHYAYRLELDTIKREIAEYKRLKGALPSNLSKHLIQFYRVFFLPIGFGDHMTPCVVAEFLEPLNSAEQKEVAFLFGLLDDDTEVLSYTGPSNWNDPLPHQDRLDKIEKLRAKAGTLQTMVDFLEASSLFWADVSPGNVMKRPRTKELVFIDYDYWVMPTVYPYKSRGLY